MSSDVSYIAVIARQVRPLGVLAVRFCVWAVALHTRLCKAIALFLLTPARKRGPIDPTEFARMRTGQPEWIRELGGETEIKEGSGPSFSFVVAKEGRK